MPGTIEELLGSAAVQEALRLVNARGWLRD
jgi:hypothetical protein